LAYLHALVLELGSMARTQVARGLQALVEGDDDLARQVIAGDTEVNRLRYEIESEAYGLLVTEQPVAGDMRAIVSGVIMVTELERIADHGKKIARIYLRMLDDPRPMSVGDIPRLGRLALDQLDGVLQVVANRDVERSRALCKADDAVDAMYKQTFNLILSYMLENPRQIAAGTHLIQVAHELERVADRATNIAERVIYVVTGELTDLNV
jgi:phosphate transport system protein